MEVTKNEENTKTEQEEYQESSEENNTKAGKFGFAEKRSCC